MSLKRLRNIKNGKEVRRLCSNDFAATAAATGISRQALYDASYRGIIRRDYYQKLSDYAKNKGIVPDEVLGHELTKNSYITRANFNGKKPHSTKRKTKAVTITEVPIQNTVPLLKGDSGKGYLMVFTKDKTTLEQAIRAMFNN